MSIKRLSRRQKRQQSTSAENILTTKLAMKPISPMTNNQAKSKSAYESGKNVANIGSAGTGKTYLSLALAVKDVMEKDEYERVIIIRSAVQSRDQGFMPGSLAEKMSYYESPYVDIVNDLFGRSDAYSTLKQREMIKFMSTSFVRGLTFDNSIVILDEVQNMNYGEFSTICQRIGKSSKLIVCGDCRQDDLVYKRAGSDTSCISKAVAIARKMKNFEVVEYGPEDIVRSGFVKEFILAEMELAY